MVTLAVCIFSKVGASSLDCFVKHASSSTMKNMCEQAYHKFPVVRDAVACADQCIGDKTCIMFAWAQQKPLCRLSSTCTEPTNALVGYDGYFRNSTTGSCAPSPAPPAPTPFGTWTRVFMTDAAKKGAVCIDGSPG